MNKVIEAENYYSQVLKCQSKYPFKKVTRYIPKRFTDLQDWQEEKNRKAVERFKKGDYTDKEMQRMVQLIQGIVTKSKEPKNWVVVFVPASTKEKYHKRYCTLTSYLRKHLEGVSVAYFGLTILEEGQSKHKGGEKLITPDNLYIKRHLLKIKDRNVILIDDVITTGESFRTVGDYLIDHGAKKIHGVIFAMTIHPNLPTTQQNRNNYEPVE